MKKISILGCGWVGNALHKKLLNNYNVCCLSHDIELNIKKYYYNCDSLVIAIPPGEEYLNVLKKTLELIDIHTQVILLSSISYYDAKPLVVAGEVLVTDLHSNVTILRLGGLMGYDRIAGKYTAGKTLAYDSRTNYVHRDDVLGIIEYSIKQGIVGEVFDVVSPIQSTKKQIFSQNAKAFLFKETEFLHNENVGKVLSANKLIGLLDYHFRKPNVQEFWN